MDWLPQVGEASAALQLVFLTLIGLGVLAILILVFRLWAAQRRITALETAAKTLETGRAQNAARLDGLTTAVERLARHHHVGAAMGAGPVLEDDHPVIIEEAVDSSIPWVNPVHALQDHPDLLRPDDLPLGRFAEPAPITDPNLRAQPGGRALPPVPPADARKLSQYMAPARSITSGPITAVDGLPGEDTEPPRIPRHAAPDVGRHAAR